MTNDRKQALEAFKVGQNYEDDYVLVHISHYQEHINALSQPTPQELCDKIVERLEGNKEHPRLTPDHEIDRAEFEAKNDTLNKAIEIVKEVCGECGMHCHKNEYHPYVACLLFKQVKNAQVVRDNLGSVMDYARAHQDTRAETPKDNTEALHCLTTIQMFFDQAMDGSFYDEFEIIRKALKGE